MGGNGEKSSDFYQVLGLKKECTETELKNAYKKLAMKWHPDRCSAAGNSKYVEEAKNKFQAIQEAYSVLSNTNKRFLYDVGVYDSDDDENGMADFMSEMAAMMRQNKPNEKGESLEELKDLFEDLFESDVESFGWTSHSETSTCLLSSSTSSNKRGSSAMSNTKAKDPLCFDARFQGFSQGVNTRRGVAAGGRGDTPNVVIRHTICVFDKMTTSKYRFYLLFTVVI
ncbi:dnaJ homolog subfamily B member 7 isoform X2 [Cynara cardunculus var. scolymus]|uniref:dnaJ homolog subfamily B member 7 isoform X2 n=1 Tax=Cynara cardunculus var. scolymus TaxID=59895 RepID=UPI000D62E112|nr:dnaJ homolog subfamily B member 7 isoform X2 [Cynara cardunculus var. scolymus]